MTFTPVYKDYLWGGHRIATRYARETPACCAESWELSDHSHGMSIVESGPMAGLSLNELVRKHSAELFGPNRVLDRFPLLIKLIDASDRLSVQVHPNELSARTTGGEPKTELWYVLDGPEDMAVYTGLVPGTTRETLENQLQSGKIDSLLVRQPLHQGDLVFVPGGLVHSIDRGCFLLEVQQNSDTTYRLWDWGRVDSSGQSRPLHIEQALECIDWHGKAEPYFRPTLPSSSRSNADVVLIDNAYFKLRLISLKESRVFKPLLGWPEMIFLIRGSIRLTWSSETLSVNEGRLILIPSSLSSYQIEPDHDQPAEFLIITEGHVPLWVVG